MHSLITVCIIEASSTPSPAAPLCQHAFCLIGTNGFLISSGSDDLGAVEKERLVAALQCALTGCQQTLLSASVH